MSERIRVRPLGVALLAAVLVHGLWLAGAQLRQRGQTPPAPLRAADDTPELLVFSRQAPEPTGLETVPLPPPPPPPPELPAQGSKPRARSGTARRPPKRPQPKPPQRPAARAGAATRGTLTREAVAAGAAAPLQSPTPLQRLQEARRRGDDGAALRVEGEALQNWRSLWQNAEAGATAPAALADRPDDVELRRLPLERARAEGVEPESGRVLRLGDHLLLPWIEGGQLWLLRAPA